MKRLGLAFLLGAVTCNFAGCGGSRPAPPDLSDVPAEARAEEEALQAAIQKREAEIQKRMNKKH